jgi:CxxC motif-containing protein
MLSQKQVILSNLRVEKDATKIKDIKKQKTISNINELMRLLNNPHHKYTLHMPHILNVT